MFTPVSGTNGLQYIYIGQIDLDCWFSDPMTSQRLAGASVY